MSEDLTTSPFSDTEKASQIKIHFICQHSIENSGKSALIKRFLTAQLTLLGACHSFPSTKTDYKSLKKTRKHLIDVNGTLWEIEETPNEETQEEQIQKIVDAEKEQRAIQLTICQNVLRSADILPNASGLDITANYVKQPSSNLIILHLSDTEEQSSLAKEILEAEDIKKLLSLVILSLNRILSFIRHCLASHFVEYLVNILHRLFYIPHSTLHMPKDTDEDSSIAYNRFQPRAITGALCWSSPS